MLTFSGGKARYCDGASRRDFLKVGVAGIGGLTLADLLRSEAQADSTQKKKSIINIYLGGGPTHLDTFDLKPEAPAEIRGPFQPIASNVPGMEICYLMPKLAQQMDKSVIIRSISDYRNEHRSTQSETGWNSNELKSLGGYPSLGSVVARIQGTTNGNAPTFVDLNGHSQTGYLSPVYAAYRPDSTGKSNLKLNSALSETRMHSRKSLLEKFDTMRRDTDNMGMMGAMDSFTERAITLVTSGEIYKALDLRQEDPRLLERYGLKNYRSPKGNERLILARRLVEAGVRCVSLSFGGWDTHSQNFDKMKEMLPELDLGLAGLIEDLDIRGMLDDTIICMSGEFGRTPRINGNAGRDHWSKSGFFYIAGGGFKTGQVIGATNRLGETPQDRPVPLHEVFATLYHQLGIDCHSTTLIDPNGRPQFLTNVREPMPELV